MNKFVAFIGLVAYSFFKNCYNCLLLPLATNPFEVELKMESVSFPNPVLKKHCKEMGNK